jgi:hypothetical protein
VAYDGPLVEPPQWAVRRKRECRLDQIEGWEADTPYGVIVGQVRPIVAAHEARIRREAEEKEEARLLAIEASDAIVPGVYSLTGGATWMATATYRTTGRTVRMPRIDPSNGGEHPWPHLALAEAVERCRRTGRPLVEVEAPSPTAVRAGQTVRSLRSVGAIST